MIKAEYISHMGNDLTVVNSARVSFNKESEFGEDGLPTAKDTKLINYLAKHNHFTPFTHPQITLRETIPLFVARQRFKHVIGFSYNEVSRRYVDDNPEFYRPPVWRARPDGSMKQGSGEPIQHSLVATDNYNWFITQAETMYKELLAMGVAPEMARMVLPQSMLTSYYVTGSLAAFARAYNLRKDSHAQVEIQMLADEWNKVIEPLFPHSWAALTSIN